MELLFDYREREAVLERFGIDLEIYTQTLIFLEDVNEKNVYSYFNERFDIVSKYLSTIRRVDSQPCSSLFYYFSECQKAFVGKRRSADSDDKRNMALIKTFLCSAYNYICYLVAEATFNPRRKTVVVFEACPRDLPAIQSRREARKIKQQAKFYRVNCVLSFGTNINTFKFLCDKYRIDYMHFVSHGEGNGDLALVGNNGFCKLLTYKTFEAYFKDNYDSSVRPKTVLCCYFNSCYSNIFINKMCASSSMMRVFKHRIGHIGVNDDDLAIFSAVAFYNCAFRTNDVIYSFLQSVERVRRSRYYYGGPYANEMLLR